MRSLSGARLCATMLVVSGIDKVHAIVGGFHLVPPQHASGAGTISLMQALDPDYIIPGHCTGETFIGAAPSAMPDRILHSIVGTRYQLEQLPPEGAP